MRTTVALPEDLIRDLKAVAARRGTSPKTVLRLEAEEEIRRADREASRRLKFPLLASRESGRLHLANAETEALSA